MATGLRRINNAERTTDAADPAPAGAEQPAPRADPGADRPPAEDAQVIPVDHADPPPDAGGLSDPGGSPLPDAAAGAAVDRSQPGAEWLIDGTRFRRAKNGQLQRWGIANVAGGGTRTGWSFVPDPDRPVSAASIAGRLRGQRRRAKLAAVRRAALPFEAPSEDEIRAKLRGRMRRNQPGTDKPQRLELPTLSGVNALSIATRFLPDGRSAFIEAIQRAMLELCPCAQAWWDVYLGLTAYERDKVSLDDVCAAAGVRPSKLMAEVIPVAMEAGEDAGRLVAALMHPKVIAAMAESAADLKGPNPEVSQRDRHAFLQGRGFLPVPRNAVINVHASASAQAAAAASSEPSVPSFAADLGGAAIGSQSARAALPATDPTLDLVQLPEPAEAILINSHDD